MDVGEAVARYAAGWFPMDDRPGEPELPWYAVDERALFGLDDASRAALARRVRRSLRACADWPLRVDAAFEEVLDLCAEPPDPEDGVWITPRLRALYLELHAEGWAHSFELWTPDGDLGAGILAVVVGRAAMLESMRRVHPHAGNALLSRTLDRLAAAGALLCDIQTLTPHTERLGARLVPRADYERRLAAAIGFTGR